MIKGCLSFFRSQFLYRDFKDIKARASVPQCSLKGLLANIIWGGGGAPRNPSSSQEYGLHLAFLIATVYSMVSWIGPTLSFSNSNGAIEPIRDSIGKGMIKKNASSSPFS